MYNPEEIKDSFLGLIGWRQGYEPDQLSIASSLTATRSGQYFQDFHPLLTLDNLKSIAPNVEEPTYSIWVSATTYAKGDLVTFSEVNYRALQNTQGQQPNLNPNSWEVFTSFSNWVEDKTKSSILKAFRNFWSEKMAAHSAKSILESKPLFTGTGRLADTVEETANLVGFEIVPIRADGVTTTIKKIGLQFTGTEPITIELYHSSNPEPVHTQTFTRTKDGGLEWFDVDSFVLPYVSNSNDYGGSWYLVYDQNLIGNSKAVTKSKDWSKKICGACNQTDLVNQRIWSKYLEIHPFKTNNFNSGELWGIADNLYTYTTNYGLNLQISISCDFTELVKDQESIFQNVIGLQVAADFLREFAYNPNFRIGRTQQNFNRMELLYELDGDSQSRKHSGIVYDLKQAMKAVSLDVTSLSRVCFPCGKRGIRHRTV